jgi:D-glycero-alpha-D-manno-heptose-7-phosphate kinase
LIITRTPLRISFFGGGTDIERFWSQEDGCVLSCTIDKYIYVIVKESYDGRIHIRCFEDESVDSVDEIKHDLIREAMRLTGIKTGIEITILSDIPHTGSGLGSSSSLTVGLLNALYAFKGIELKKDALAQLACDIEINILGKPIGKQDQYIAAFGGMRVLTFKSNGNVEVQAVEPAYDIYKILKDHLLLFYTGVGRKAEGILEEQNRLINNTRPILREMKNQVAKASDIIARADIKGFGELMREGWIMKKQLASEISNSWINETIEKAYAAGALAAKITGAGGGGFLLIFCEPEFHDSVRNALGELKEFPFSFERQGSTKLFLN